MNCKAVEPRCYKQRMQDDAYRIGIATETLFLPIIHNRDAKTNKVSKLLARHHVMDAHPSVMKLKTMALL